jgi:hypothetical protein
VLKGETFASKDGLLGLSSGPNVDPPFGATGRGIEGFLAGILGLSALLTGGGLEPGPFVGFCSAVEASGSGFGVDGRVEDRLEW